MNFCRRKHHLAAALAGLLAAACAAQPGAQGAGAVEEGGAAKAEPLADKDRGDLPPTSDEVMYRVFAAEVLGADGDLDKAAAEYLAAALESEDPEVAQRATQVALAAQAWQYAAMAAVRWAELAPADPEALETAARTLLMADDYVGAEHQMSELLTVMQEDPMAAWGTVARLLSAARHPDKASQVLQRLIESHDAVDNPFALYARSQLAARAGDLEAASELAERAVSGAPGVPELHAWAGRVAVNMGDQLRATQHYEKAWTLRPDDRVHALLYAELLRQSGFPDRANEVLASLPDTPETRFTRVAFALQTEKRALAEDLYRGFNTVTYENLQEHAFQAARAAELLEWPGEAVRWYEQVRDGEQGLVAIGRRAFLLAELGRVAEARQVLTEARQGGSPEIQIETLIVESQILIEADQSEAALEVLTTALVEFPGDTRLLYTRALVAVELDRLDVAERDLRKVIEQNPQNAAALNALGYTLADRTDRFAEAESLISAAYRLDPEEASIIDSMGWVAYKLGRLEEAESYLRQAFARDRNAEIAAHLGEVLWVSGNQDDAREIWNVGLEIDSSNRVLVETLGRFGVQL